MDLSEWLAAAQVAVAVAIPAVGAAYWFFRRRKGNRKDAFRQGLSAVGTDQHELTRIAWLRTPPHWKRYPWFQLLAPGDSWIPNEPFEITDVKLSLHSHSNSTNSVARAKDAASDLLKPLDLGSRARYSTALTKLSGMNGLFDGTIYRPIGIDFGQEKRIDFERASYFEYLDTSEVLSLEMEVRKSSGSLARGGTYRKSLGNPFNLQNRVCSLGINTLTLRLALDGSATFFLHLRDPLLVANSSGLIALAPAGEFTPSSITMEAMTEDFDFRRNVIREYAEEFLGHKEARGQGGVRIDFAGETPFSDIWEGMQNGSIVLKGLGIGLDPLTWKPELLTVCTFQAAIFDTIFANMVRRNDEGALIIGENNVGLAFNEDTVKRYRSAPFASPTAAAALHLCWRSRRSLGVMSP
jgi:hypothetical protein